MRNLNLKYMVKVSNVSNVNKDQQLLQCTEIGCEAQFGRRKSRWSHVQIVHKKRYLNCSETGCERKFGAKKNMLRHTDEYKAFMHPQGDFS